MDQSTFKKMYEQMFLIRTFEVALERLFEKGCLFGTVHSCAGQEAVAVGIINALSKGDLITGNHRSHGHYIAYSKDVKGLMAEIMGKACGIVGGRGGSQHLYKEGFYTNGVQGSMVPVATGMALAEKLKGSNNIIVCFIGDGTLGQGVVYESMNMASLWDLPVMYVLENNFYAMSTRVSTAVSGSIIKRGEAFGIESSEITSNDVENIHNEAIEIIKKIRSTSRPYFWVINTYRLSGHSKGDDRCYRPREEEAEWTKCDPLLIAGLRIDKSVREQIEEKCKEIINETVSEIEKMEFPQKDTLFNGI